jgi:hypothetical protein
LTLSVVVMCRATGAVSGKTGNPFLRDALIRLKDLNAVLDPGIVFVKQCHRSPALGQQRLCRLRVFINNGGRDT